MDMFCLQPTAALDRLGSGGGGGSCLGERTDGIEPEEWTEGVLGGDQ